jgi:endo-1,4-beta-xylanase
VPPTAPGQVPSVFQWTSTGPLVNPHSDATHTLTGIKDPSVVYYDGKYHVFASTTDNAGKYSMVYLSFADWSKADSAPQYYLDQTPIGTGYKTAPMVFYFTPQKLWYLVYQTGGNAAYSTNSDLTNPAGWTAPKNFYASEPSIIKQNIGSGTWVDMWVICDAANCHLFSMDDNGHVYRSQTSVANFPNGMSEPVIALQSANRHDLYEADNVYRVQGTDQYLMIAEAWGSGAVRYFRSWTATSLDGTWTPLTGTEASPFAGSKNVTFAGTAWTKDFSSGEAIRSNYDQTVTINPCAMQYAYQGRDPSVSTGSYSTLPWRIGLLTQSNSTCSRPTSSAPAAR